MQANQAISNVIPAKFGLSPTQPTDTTLLNAIARGDNSAMQTLCSRHWLSIYRLSRSIAGDPATADDIVSQVFLRIWRCARAFNAPSQVSTWLLAVTHDLAYAALRQRRTGGLTLGAVPQIEDDAADPMVASNRATRRTLLARCLRQLSAPHREVIDLVYYHEKSIREVSEIVAIPPAAVISRMHDARNEIADFMANIR